jgi:hypothetical protein
MRGRALELPSTLQDGKSQVCGEFQDWASDFDTQFMVVCDRQF